MTQPLHHDDLDLLMRICERQGYGCHYGRFVAETTPAQRRSWLDKERKKQDKRDAKRREELEAMKNGIQTDG